MCVYLLQYTNRSFTNRLVQVKRELCTVDLASLVLLVVLVHYNNSI